MKRSLILLVMAMLLTVFAVTPAMATVSGGRVEVTSENTSEVFTVNIALIDVYWENASSKAVIYGERLKHLGIDEFAGGQFITDDTYAALEAAINTAQAASVTDMTVTGSFVTGVGYDATGAVDIDYGSADITDHTFTSDGTGTAEFVLVAGAIDGTEILDDTVDSADYAAASIDEEHMAANSVDSDSYVDDSIDVEHLAEIGHIVETGGASIVLTPITELVTIGVAEGATPIVVSSSNLAAIGNIEAISWRVIDAPGGGATTIDIGITGGDADGLCDGASCNVLNESGSLAVNHGSSLALTDLLNSTATTFDFTTDADVTDDEMIIEITVWTWVTTLPPSA